jgi:dienelactone hydrolase
VHPRRTLFAGLLITTVAVLSLALAGCAQPTTRWHAKGSTIDSPAQPNGSAPAKPFAVGVRKLSLARNAERPLPTTIWYPAAGPAATGAKSGATPAAGRFPLIVFSHGLTGLPENYAQLTTRWAAAGFVVAAPAFPHTNANAAKIDVLDLGNQPEDASYVITAVLALDAKAGDPLAGHLDPARVAAAGHSAGGYTTVGMFTSRRDSRLAAGIVIAGGLLGGAYTGRATPLLFVHGDADPTVSYATGRTAFDRAPWPKAFLTLIGQGHGERYLGPGFAPFDAAMATMTDFLRWVLYGDAGAKARLPGDGTVAGVCRLESSL